MYGVDFKQVYDECEYGFVQEMLMDSGSVSNLRGEEDFFKLKGLSLKGKVEHCSKKLFAYGESKLM